MFCYYCSLRFDLPEAKNERKSYGRKIQKTAGKSKSHAFILLRYKYIIIFTFVNFHNFIVILHMSLNDVIAKAFLICSAIWYWCLQTELRHIVISLFTYLFKYLVSSNSFPWINSTLRLLKDTYLIAECLKSISQLTVNERRKFFSISSTQSLYFGFDS